MSTVLSLVLAYTTRVISIFVVVIASIGVSSAIDWPLWIVLVAAAVIYLYHRRIVTSLRATGPIFSLAAVAGLYGVIQATLHEPVLLKIFQSELYVGKSMIATSILILFGIGIVQAVLISTTMRDFVRHG